MLRYTRFGKLATAKCISKLLLSQILPEQTGCNWTCPCTENNHPLRVAPAGGTNLTRPDHPKQRGPCGRKHAFCGVIPPVNCLNNSGCGYTLQMNSVVNGMLTTSPRIGSTSFRTTDARYLKPADECQDHSLATSIYNDMSRLGTVFRRRFQIPYSMCVDLCQRYVIEADHRKSHDATGKTKKHDVRLLALGAFRLIGRDLVFNDLEALNGISATAKRAFFFSFLPWLAGLSTESIVLPRTAEELKHVSDPYRCIGVPGCAGSDDCVHIFWGMCPANLQSRCKGKEPRNVSSLVFELVSSHTKRILSVSGVQYGTDSDKTISRSDSAVLRIRKEGDILKESTFGYYTEDGSVAEEQGYYCIVDGGYNNWIELIAPFKQEPESSIAHIWSKQIEPVHMDVDCVFGILKKRFMILKHPMRLRKMESIEHVFLACAVLHNMLIDYDGRDD